jgi:alpha-tubulin suppressor-like RCC1 family protein
MVTQIFINDNVPDINTFIDGIKDIVTIHKFDNLIDKYDLNVNRIGFVWHNDRMDIPFGSTELTIDNYTFTYFKKELIDYLQLYNNITVDLITCYLDDPLFLSEVEIIFNNLNNINIEYSLDATGNINGNWIMESNNSSILDIYFNNLIKDYKYILGNGGDHTAIIAEDGTVWTFGRNTFGQLGNNSTTNSNVPVQVVIDTFGTALTGAIAVSCGNVHMAVLKNDGTVWTFGNNTNGQFGNGTNINSSVAVQSNISNVVAIACGGQHNIVLKDDGTVWTYGLNTSGELGIGNNLPSNVPVQVTDISNNAVAIGCGQTFTFVTKNDGTVWTFGSNINGQLGDGTIINKDLPVQVPGITNAIAATGGNSHSLILKGDGTVWAFGNNANGQLGDGTIINKSIPTLIVSITGAIKIACGALHSLIYKSDDTVWTIGSNGFGQLGDNTLIDSSTPVQVQDGSGNISDVLTVSCGFRHTAVLKNDKTVQTFGRNTYGQLGDGTNTNRTIATNIAFGQNVVNIMDGIETIIEEITTEEITTEAITTEEITTEAITTEEITTEAITTEALTTEAITTEAITTEAITTEEITTTPVPTSPSPLIFGVIFNGLNVIDFGL